MMDMEGCDFSGRGGTAFGLDRAARMLYWHQQLQWQVQKTPQSIRLLEKFIL